jgi:hypothetical protein
MFLAIAGYAIGLDEELLRTISAFLMVGIGAVLAVPKFNHTFAVLAGPAGNWLNDRFSTDPHQSGGLGQFGVGLLLGVLMLATGLFVLSGLDKQVEAFLVETSPAWMTNLTTRY